MACATQRHMCRRAASAQNPSRTGGAGMPHTRHLCKALSRAGHCQRAPRCCMYGQTCGSFRGHEANPFSCCVCMRVYIHMYVVCRATCACICLYFVINLIVTEQTPQGPTDGAPGPPERVGGASRGAACLSKSNGGRAPERPDYCIVPRSHRPRTREPTRRRSNASLQATRPCVTTALCNQANVERRLTVFGEDCARRCSSPRMI